MLVYSSRGRQSVMSGKTQKVGKARWQESEAGCPLCTQTLEVESEQEVGSVTKPPGPHPNDPLPVTRLQLLKVPQPSWTAPPAKGQEFKYMSLQGGYLTFKPHSAALKPTLYVLFISLFMWRERRLWIRPWRPAKHSWRRDGGGGGDDRGWDGEGGGGGGVGVGR